MEFVSPEICVSSPPVFLDSFPQLTDIYLTPCWRCSAVPAALATRGDTQGGRVPAEVAQGQQGQRCRVR